MISMIEKKYISQDMNIELTSFLDSKQNVWFRGKDVARILGYSVTDQAIRKHVSDNHKQLTCCPVKTRGQQNDTRGKYCTFINEAGFYELVLVPNYQLLKSSVTGYSLLYSHQSVNMANTNYLIVPGIT